jgi:bacteriorhodopsin
MKGMTEKMVQKMEFDKVSDALKSILSNMALSAGADRFNSNIRACGLRVVAGSLLLACACCVGALVSYDFYDHAASTAAEEFGVPLRRSSEWVHHSLDKFATVMAAGVCAVAFFHYKKLIEIREASAEGLDDETEALCDCVRYCDWLVTLPVLGAELSAMFAGTFEDFNGSGTRVVAGLLLAMVGCGGVARATCRGRGRTAALFMTIAFVLLYFSVSDLQDKRDGGKRTQQWVLTSFVTVPWALYGVAALAINTSLARGPASSDRGDQIVLRSIGGDLVYGLLDIWCKACLAFYASGKLAKVWGD